MSGDMALEIRGNDLVVGLKTHKIVSLLANHVIHFFGVPRNSSFGISNCNYFITAHFGRKCSLSQVILPFHIQFEPP